MCVSVVVCVRECVCVCVHARWGLCMWCVFDVSVCVCVCVCMQGGDCACGVCLM